LISVDRVTVRAGSFALEEVSFEIPAGHYGVLMGRTGCGKTTVLEAICGLRAPAGGMIRLMGRDVTRLKAAERGIGYVPQDGALFKTMTVRQNLGFALRVRRWRRQEVARRVEELAQMLSLSHVLDRKPAGLSGGEAQRVSLGRALACSPSILCLDEPLSSLDYETKDQMCNLLKAVQQQTGVTTLHVTHDRDQGRTLADRLLQLVDGKVRQVEGVEV
jgi:molybdate/tungstate transport system ATP-binding protein